MRFSKAIQKQRAGTLGSRILSFFKNPSRTKFRPFYKPIRSAFDGGYGLPAWAQTRARLRKRIVEHGNPVVAVPTPSLTVSDTSVISGAITLVEDAATRRVIGGDLYRFPYDGTNWATFYSVNARADGSVPEALGGGVEFVTAAQSVEIIVGGGQLSGVGALVRVWVNGELVQVDPVLVQSLTGQAFLRLVFADSEARVIRCDFDRQARFHGIKVPSGFSAAAHFPVNPITMVVAGDSFTEGVGATFNGTERLGTFSYATLASINLGIDNFRNSGLGGTGWAAVNGARVNLLQRLQLDVINPAPDVFVAAVGINDSDVSAAVANAATGLDAVHAALPAAICYVIGPWDAWAPGAMGATPVAVREGLREVCSARPFAKFLDPTGIAFSKSDSTHPDLAGHQTLAAWLSAAIRDDLHV